MSRHALARLRAWAALLVLAAPGRTDAVEWGVDLSSLPQVAAAGGQWSVEGQPADPLAAFAEEGWGLLRLRLWHTPAEPWQAEPAVLAQALAGQAAGMAVLLDFHYSDSWADPGQQTPPAAWAGLSAASLEDSVRAYTRGVLERFAAAGVVPRAVQLGNEIDGGLLWPTGRVDGAYDTAAQWRALRGLLRAASQGVEQAFAAPAECPRRILHQAGSGWWAGRRRFLDSLTTSDGPAFEIAGFSYYPWWHGEPSLLQQTLDGAATRYGKPVWIVETAYPFSLGWNDNTFNLVGEAGQLVAGYPATAAGQEAFFQHLRGRLAAVPGGLGEALLLWEPAWISAPGLGSSVENLCLFDFQGAALPALGLPGRLDLFAPELEARFAAGQLRLEWSPVPGARGYVVECAGSPAGPWEEAARTAQPGWSTPVGPARAVYRVRSTAGRP